MSIVLLQTCQSPFSFNWCGNNLGQYTTGALSTLTDHLAPTNNSTGGVYLNPSGSSTIGNVYNNGRGTYSYSISGGYNGFPQTTAPPYNDNGLASAISGTTQTYRLLILDLNSGQKYTFVNSIVWN